MTLRRESFKIVVKRVERPFSNDPVDEFEWICQSLGFFEPIDRERTATAIFREIFKATEEGRPITSAEIVQKIGMSRGAVVNHLNNLIRSGLIVKNGRYYQSRSKSVYRIIEEIEDDIDRIFLRMKKVAQELDEQLGIESGKELDNQK
jgi:predicted transcriptional regulator